jgi:hypothetical protein
MRHNVAENAEFEFASALLKKLQHWDQEHIIRWSPLKSPPKTPKQ